MKVRYAVLIPLTAILIFLAVGGVFAVVNARAIDQKELIYLSELEVKDLNTKMDRVKSEGKDIPKNMLMAMDRLETIHRDHVDAYNTMVKKFPTNIVLKLLGYEEFVELSEGSDLNE